MVHGLPIGNQLIGPYGADDRVLAVAAQKDHLYTSDQKLARDLQQNEFIASLRRPDGTLDMDRYRQLAASQGLTPEGLENNVRLDLARQQVEAGVSASGFVVPAVADVALNAFCNFSILPCTRSGLNPISSTRNARKGTG